VIDRCDWHSEGDFPPDLPADCGGTHIGMYLAWLIRRGLDTPELLRLVGEQRDAVLQQRISGRTLLLEELDGKLFEALLTPEGQAFTKAYYETNQYLQDYDAVLGGELPTLYHVEDTWENFDRLAPVLDRRLAQWRAGSSPGSSPPP
jgi:hypothetical protein